MKVAIIHDWLPVIAGAERVLEQILKVYPGADVYTMFDFLSEEDRGVFGDVKITTSSLNKWPKVQKYYRKLLPIMPFMIENFDLSEYDLIISSSHAVAKGVITGAEQIHVSYVHSPTRYAWDLTHQYLRESNMQRGFKGMMARYFLHKFRIWDLRTANGVDGFIANSDYIRKRIWKVYRREADVVYPSADIELFEYSENKEDFYFTASRMVPYKRIDMIAAAFAKMPNKKLKIIGDGPDMHKVKKIADNASNIEILGYQSHTVLRDHMQRAKAFVFAAEEDFGIVPVEAQACGTPVIAYGAGGALETVIDYRDNPKTATGMHFYTQSADALAEAVQAFDDVSDKIPYKNCRKNAERFSEVRFRKEFKETVEKYLREDRLPKAA